MSRWPISRAKTTAQAAFASDAIVIPSGGDGSRISLKDCTRCSSAQQIELDKDAVLTSVI